MNTTDSIYKRLLFEGSPLIPGIDRSTITKTINQIGDSKNKSILIMAKIALEVKEDLESKILESPSPYLMLGVNMDNLFDFLLGFAMPNYVILNCYQQPFGDTDYGDDDELINRTEYINKISALLVNKVQTASADKIAATITKIFTACENDPYIDNDFYKAGVVASLITMREFLIETELINKR